MRRSAVPGTLVALGVLLAGVVFAFSLGRFPLSLHDWLAVLWLRIAGAPSVETVVLNGRAPRVVAAVAVGAALSVAGTAFQGLFRNPLVSPDILGASSGAAFGAVLGIFLSLGIVIGSLLGAGVGLLKVLADPYNQLPAMTFWLLGSLSGTDSSDLVPLLAPVVLGTAVLLLLCWKMNVMSLPEEEARALGAQTTALRLAIVTAATLVTAASVAAAGIVGWVGLVVPHLARFLVGPSFARLLPAAAILGGGFLLFIDTLARTMAPIEVPLGILTAIVGTPFFIWLLKSARGGWS